MRIKPLIVGFLGIFLIIAGISKAERLIPKQPKLFSPSQLATEFSSVYTHPFSYKEKAVIESLKLKPLTYLGKGRHSIAFLSADGKKVLKFFRHNPRNHYWYTQLIPAIPPFTEWKWKKEQCRLKYVIAAYQNGSAIDKEGYGILFSHLSPTYQELGKVTLIDRHGIRHLVSLDTTLFVVQEKVTELREVLAKHLDQGDLEGAKQKLNTISNLYHKHYSLGLYDWGIGILHNSGFVNEKPVHFDISKLVVDEKMKDPKNQSQDFARQLKRIQKWLHKHYPEYSTEMLTSCSSISPSSNKFEEES